MNVLNGDRRFRFRVLFSSGLVLAMFGSTIGFPKTSKPPSDDPAKVDARATATDSSSAAQPDPLPDVTAPVKPVRTGPLRDMPPIPWWAAPESEHPEPITPNPPLDDPKDFAAYSAALQTVPGPVTSAPTPTGVSWDGVGVGLAGFTPNSNPPDVNGRVGATQYVQWNNTAFAVFDKTNGALLYGPAAGSTLFQSLGGACATHNDGDPVVAYDILAGRWILSQFVVSASPSFSHQCVAVSVTQDATGAYYLYDFVTDVTNFVDYPKIGVWPDGYYMSAHVFNAAGTSQVASRVYVFERTQMIQGATARMQVANLPTISGLRQYGFLPADLDSLTPPPAGEAEFVIGPNPASATSLASTRVAVTWGVTPTIGMTSALIGITSAGTAPCLSNTSGQNFRDCVPQPAPAVATDDLDRIANRLMYRLAYRNFGGSPVQESLVANSTGLGSGSPTHGSVRWYEFRNAGNSTATPTVFQFSTFNPDTAYRWMASIAMDKNHNIAVGYSKSSTSILPSIFINGRLGTDAANALGTEALVQAGAGVQFSTGATGSAGNRWGDYSAMTIDPVDQCTFYYTNEYLKTNGAFNWSTRIASYKFPSCTPAAAWGAVSGTITSCATGAPVSGAVVTLSNGYAAASDASGIYSISVPAGSYTAAAADATRNCTSASPVSVAVNPGSGGTATQDFCMTGSSKLESNGTTIDDASGNANGVINGNECVSLNLGVKNNGCGTETAIAATLTTPTAGVTIVQGNRTYPDLAIDASGAQPFQIQTSNTFVCGTAISLSLNLTYASGSTSVSYSVHTCDGGAGQTIPTSSLTTADLTQGDRIGRNSRPSACVGKTCPGGGFAGTKYYKTFGFTNTSGSAECFTATIDAAAGGAGDIESQAYQGSYDPANLCTNYLGDSGIVGLGTTVTSAAYSFLVPAQSNFVVVVNTTGTTTSSPFSGTVSGFVDTTGGPGPCAETCSGAPDGTACSDGNACTQPDTCQSGVCTGGAAVVCNDNNVCTDDSCSTTTGCVYTLVPERTCDDGNPCTAGDVCTGGACAGSAIAVPAETRDLAVAADKSTYSWSAVSVATVYDVVRGGTEAFPVGPGGGDEVCFENLSAPALVDTAAPPPDAAFWYLSRARNDCGRGPLGTQGDGTPRVTTTCP